MSFFKFAKAFFVNDPIIFRDFISSLWLLFIVPGLLTVDHFIVLLSLSLLLLVF